MRLGEMLTLEIHVGTGQRACTIWTYQLSVTRGVSGMRDRVNGAHYTLIDRRRQEVFSGRFLDTLLTQRHKARKGTCLTTTGALSRQ